jgi:hypothetical protein
VHETDEDLAWLQGLLDRSFASAGEHLGSILAPELRSSAREVSRALTGIFVINLATGHEDAERLTANVADVVEPIGALVAREYALIEIDHQLLRLCIWNLPQSGKSGDEMGNSCLPKLALPCSLPA